MKDEIINCLNLPKDVFLGTSTIHITGQYSMVVENYKAIIDYNEEHVFLCTKECKINIIGDKLQIDYLSDYDIKISGKIFQIIFNN